MLLHISMFLNLIDEEKDCAKDFGKNYLGTSNIALLHVGNM